MAESAPSWSREDVPVIFQDDELFVVDKPAGLVVHPAPGVSEPTLAELFSDDLAGGEEDSRAGIVHRLDRGTSGLMLLARTPNSHSMLQQAIERREVERTYLALVAGSPRTKGGRIDAPIGRSPRERHRMAVDGAGAREAVTHFEVVESSGGYSLLRVRLETGRTHQVRVHMKAIGTPIVGDLTYGGSDPYDLGRPFLHSTRLAFSHPGSGAWLEFESGLPDQLERVLRVVGEADSTLGG